MITAEEDRAFSPAHKRLSVFGQPCIQLLTRLRPEFITSADCSTIELHKQLKEAFLDRLPQPMQLFSDIERWKKECISLVKWPTHTHPQDGGSRDFI